MDDDATLKKLYPCFILEVDKASRMLVSFNLDEKKVEEILDEMRPIRCIEHKGHAKRITPFVGKQLEICRVFGFNVPDGCDTMYKSKKVNEKKRGRPRKTVVVNEPKE